MKYIQPLLIILLISSCQRSFINHELKAERIGACNTRTAPVKLTSNINGERYEFEYCLDNGFNEKDYQVSRKGDSLIVSFNKPGARSAMYRLTLDIDAKPAYRHILLGETMVEISPSALAR